MANPSSILTTIIGAFLFTHQHVATATTFDYIIAGGGTCGLLLANRLTEDAGVTVAVVEPGGDERANPNVTDPGRSPTATWGTPVDWAYPTVPQAGGANRTLTMHAGKALGGSSAINGMVYIRADAAEIDAWGQLLGGGDDNNSNNSSTDDGGWSWASLLPYYQKVEAFTPPTEAQVRAGASYDPAHHGRDGDLHVGFRYALPNGSLYPVVRDTWANLGYDVNRDVNSGDQRGFSVYPQTVDRDRDVRWDAARAFYVPVDGRPNLHVLRGTVAKILWADDDSSSSYGEGGDKGRVARGVEYVDSDGTTRTASAEKEVILSAGALRTPLILEGSGVGNTK